MFCFGEAISLKCTYRCYFSFFFKCLYCCLASL